MRFTTFIYLVLLIVIALSMQGVRDSLTYVFVSEYEQKQLEDLLDSMDSNEDAVVIPKKKEGYDI